MNIYLQILLIIASIGLTIVFLLLIAFMFYLVGAIYTIKKILDKVEKNIGYVAKTTIAAFGEIKSSKFLDFIFGRGKNTKDKKS